MKVDVYIYVLNVFLFCILKILVKNFEEICMYDECNVFFGFFLF